MLEIGGWQQVFASIARQDVSRALAFNDLMVIQIDTDVCEQTGFDVPRRDGGRELTEEELVARVQERLLRAIAERDPTADLKRVAFAICVNEIECWLLLHLSPRSKKTLGCLAEARRTSGRTKPPHTACASRLRWKRSTDAHRASTGS